MIGSLKRKRLKNSIFKVDNQEITDPVDIANRFCSYFSSIGPNLAITLLSLTAVFSPVTFVNRCFLVQ